MSRLKFLLPAAALLLAGAVTSAPAQAAPVALAGTVEAIAGTESGVTQVSSRRWRNWYIEHSDSGRWDWRRHRRHRDHHGDRHHHRRDNHHHNHRHRYDRHR
jgi:hypothetical protein